MYLFLKKILFLLFVISISSNSHAGRTKRGFDDLTPAPNNEESLTPKATRVKLTSEPEQTLLQTYDFFFDDRIKDESQLKGGLLLDGMNPSRYKLLLAWVSSDPLHTLYGSPKPIYAEPQLFGLSRFLNSSDINRIASDTFSTIKDNDIARVMALLLTHKQLSQDEEKEILSFKNRKEKPWLSSMFKLMLFRKNSDRTIDNTFRELHYLVGTLFPQLKIPNNIPQLQSFLVRELSIEFAERFCRYLILDEKYESESERVKVTNGFLRETFKSPRPYMNRLYEQLELCLKDPHVHPGLKARAELLAAKMKLLFTWVDPRATIKSKLGVINDVIQIERYSDGISYYDAIREYRKKIVRCYIEKGLYLVSHLPKFKKNRELIAWRNHRSSFIQQGNVTGNEGYMGNEDRLWQIMTEFLSDIMRVSQDPVIQTLGLNWLEYQALWGGIDEPDFSDEDSLLYSFIRESGNESLKRRAILVVRDMRFVYEVFHTVQSQLRPYEDFTPNLREPEEAPAFDTKLIETLSLKEEVLVRRLMCRLHQFGSEWEDEVSDLKLHFANETAQLCVVDSYKSASSLASEFLIYLSQNPKSPLNCLKFHVYRMSAKLKRAYEAYKYVRGRWGTNKDVDENDKGLILSLASQMQKALTLRNIRSFFWKLEARKRGFKFLETPTLKMPSLE